MNVDDTHVVPHRNHVRLIRARWPPNKRLRLSFLAELQPGGPAARLGLPQAGPWSSAPLLQSGGDEKMVFTLEATRHE